MIQGGTPIDWCCPDCPQRGITDFVDMDANRHPENNEATTIDEERRPEEPVMDEDTITMWTHSNSVISQPQILGLGN